MVHLCIRTHMSFNFISDNKYIFFFLICDPKQGPGCIKEKFLHIQYMINHCYYTDGLQFSPQLELMIYSKLRYVYA